MDKILKALGLIVTGGSLLASAALPAAAAPYKVTDSAGVTKVHVDGSPSGSLAMTISLTQTKSVATTNCGWVRLSSSATRPVIGVSGIVSANKAAIDSAATGTPTCLKVSSGGYSDSHLQANLLKDTSAVWVRGSSGVASVVYETTRSIKLNACGLGSVTVSATSPFDDFSLQGTPYKVSTLTNKTAPNKCVKVGTTNITYGPI